MQELKRYLITDPKYYSSDPVEFEKTLSKVLTKHKIDYACFRDKTSSNIEELAQVFIKTCQKYKIENIFINQYIAVGKSLGFDGVHLTSKQFDQIQEVKDLGFQTVVSCHNHDEIEKAIRAQANMVTYSPIFITPNKGEPVGIENLKMTIQKYNIPIIALGGIITQEHLEFLQKVDAKVFASIRYFI
ncbi:MAG: thiamine phosphate synthase [Campylobacteraceae bacterium]|nr:thiamine phosphate synthase [Campylobacteraceae bacterium]